MHIFLELIPKDSATLQEEAQKIRLRYPEVDGLNFPDLLKYPTRSWECAQACLGSYTRILPHIRAIDFDIRKPLEAVQNIYDMGIREVLVITGDPPQELRRIYPNTSVDLIRQIKVDHPDMKVYAAIDPYRQGMQSELQYVERKINAGADGFFTQPFFDMRLLEIWQEQLAGKNVFWGISPVTSERNFLYWMTKNNTVFPKDFRTDMNWNLELGRRILDFAKQTETSAYIMPIRANVIPYLDGLLGK